MSLARARDAMTLNRFKAQEELFFAANGVGVAERECCDDDVALLTLEAFDGVHAVAYQFVCDCWAVNERPLDVGDHQGLLGAVGCDDPDCLPEEVFGVG